ncbi:MAG: WbqC family protein [Marinisporobacter sp.]|nr:WbqC family protein [Marinisporobacter sp.]
MINVAISQPRYLPACNYIHRMLLSDIFVYLDIVKYSPRDWENRNKVKLNNGKWSWMSVPVINKGREQLIKDTMLYNEEKWALKHLKMITYSYSKAKYFNRYINFFEDTYNEKWNYLQDLNIHIINFIVKELKIKCKFIKASDLDVSGKGQNLLIDICKKVGGDLYISGPLGKNYIRQDVFEKKNIELFYHNYNHPIYPQIHGEFLSYMSIIDLLFNCGEDSLKYLKKENVEKDEIKEGK